MNNDCKTPYQAETGNDKLEVTQKYPFPIIPRGYGAGQTDNVCYQCSNGYDVATARLAVDITSKCLTSLSINDKHEGVTNLDYDYFSNYQSSSSLTRSVFRNSEPEDCPILDCQLYTQGCKNSQSESAYVQLQQTMNGEEYFKARRDVIFGYNESVCLMCKNKFQSIYRDNIRFSQRNRCYNKDVLTNLDVKEKQLDYVIPYNDTVAPTFIGYGW